MAERVTKVGLREQRRIAVAAHLLSGMSLRQISHEIGVSRATVQRDVVRVMQQWRDECVRDVEFHIQKDLRRIDTAMHAIWDDVKAGQLKAIDRMLKLLHQRARYLGLYQPEQVQSRLNVNYLQQVRNETAIIADFEEIVADAAERIIGKHAGSGAGHTAGGLATEAVSLGSEQDRHRTRLLPESVGTTGMAGDPTG